MTDRNRPRSLRPVGRPVGYVHPENYPVTDPQAFTVVFAILLAYASEKPRGAISRLAEALGVTHPLVISYKRKAPRAITPELADALEIAPALMYRQPFPVDEYYALLDRSLGRPTSEAAP